MPTKFTLVEIQVDSKALPNQDHKMITMKSGNLLSNEQSRLPQSQNYHDYRSSRENNASSIINSRQRNQYQPECWQVNWNRMKQENQTGKINYLELKIPIDQNVRHSNIVIQKQFFEGFDRKSGKNTKELYEENETFVKKVYEECKRFSQKIYEANNMVAQKMKEAHQKMAESLKFSFASNKSELKPASEEKQDKKTELKEIDEKMEKKYTRITPQQKKEIRKVFENRNLGHDEIKSAIKGLSAELGIEYNTLKSHVKRHLAKQAKV